jgi:hemoglobin/transferrin/lactoferrin receptor protein
MFRAAARRPPGAWGSVRAMGRRSRRCRDGARSATRRRGPRGARGLVAVSALALAVAAAEAQEAVPSASDPRAAGAAAEGAAAEGAAPAAPVPPDGAAPELVLDEITVTATRTGQPVDEALSGSSVLDRSTVETETQPARVSDFLELIPGVTTSEQGGDPATAINIRGLQDFGRVNVMIDGARQNFQTSGHNANGVFFFDPEMLSSVDVTRGPVSTIYGSGAIGGVVEFNTLTVDDILAAGQTVGARLKTRYLTNGDEILGHAAAATRIGTAFDVVAAATGSTAGNYVDGNGALVPHSWDDMVSGLLKARWRPTDEQQITASALTFNDRYEVGSTTIRETTARSDTYTLGYRYTPLDNRWVDLTANAYLTQTGTDQTNIRGDDLGAERRFDITTTGFDLFNTSRFETGALAHAVTYGVDAFHDRVDTRDTAGSADLFTPTGERSVYGAFVQEDVRWQWLQVIAAARADGYSLSGGGTDTSGGRISPKITVGVTPVEPLTIFATYAEAWRAPALTETLIGGTHPGSVQFDFHPNPNLKPEVAHEVEIGANVRFDDTFVEGDQFRLKAVAYYNVVDDYIGQVTVRIDPPPKPPASPYYLQYQNYARVKLWGGEVEAMYDMGAAFAGVSGQIVRGVDDKTRRQLYTIPADRLVTTVGVRAFEKRLVAGARLASYAAVERAPPGYVPMAGYSVLDLFAAYSVSDRMTANLEVANVFNRQYRQYLDLTASPGLNARFAVTLKL